MADVDEEFLCVCVCVRERERERGKTKGKHVRIYEKSLIHEREERGGTRNIRLGLLPNV